VCSSDLLIFLVLVALGLVFYYKVAKSQVNNKIDTKAELSNVQIAQIASSLPEVQCSQQNILQSNCIDILKLNASINANVINQNDYFFLFGYSNITLQKIYPEADASLNLYYYAPKQIRQKLPTQMPISIYDPSTQSYFFGVLIVEVYS
jgi:hypothetical protein